MFDLSQVPVCVCTENLLYFTITGAPAQFRNLHLGHSEFWQDNITLRETPPSRQSL